jgi:hypothetical protein
MPQQFEMPPPAPNPQPEDPSSSNPMAPFQSTNPLQKLQGNGPVQPQQQMQMPAPDAAHAVAGLRHLGAIERATESLLRNPDLGKIDMKSTIIDGMTRLVADRMISPAQAVDQLTSVPPDPFGQRNWVLQHFVQAVTAQRFLISHHRAAFSGQRDLQHGHPDDHQQHVRGLMGHYQPLAAMSGNNNNRRAR